MYKNVKRNQMHYSVYYIIWLVWVRFKNRKKSIYRTEVKAVVTTRWELLEMFCVLIDYIYFKKHSTVLIIWTLHHIWYTSKNYFIFNFGSPFYKTTMDNATVIKSLSRVGQASHHRQWKRNEVWRYREMSLWPLRLYASW